MHRHPNEGKYALGLAIALVAIPVACMLFPEVWELINSNYAGDVASSGIAKWRS